MCQDASNAVLVQAFPTWMDCLSHVMLVAGKADILMMMPHVCGYSPHLWDLKNWQDFTFSQTNLFLFYCRTVLCAQTKWATMKRLSERIHSFLPLCDWHNSPLSVTALFSVLPSTAIKNKKLLPLATVGRQELETKFIQVRLDITGHSPMSLCRLSLTLFDVQLVE